MSIHASFDSIHLLLLVHQGTTLEEQLLQLRMDLDLQDYQYKKLLDTNIHLESEVAEYKRLQG